MNNDFRYLTVIDFEATCSNNKVIKAIPRDEMEIIEIGCVVLKNNAKLTKIGEYNSFVKPVIHPKLTRYCLNLLPTIDQESVDNAPYLYEVMDRFRRYMFNLLSVHEYELLYDENTFDNVLFCSYGDFDRKILKNDCKRDNIEYPFNDYHLNIKYALSKVLKCKSMGMARALKVLNLELEGKHHSGIDDANNISFILRRLKEINNDVVYKYYRKYKLDETN